MEHDKDGTSCTTTNAKNVWIAGITVTLLVTLFCVAMFKGGDVPLPGQPVGAGTAAGQQAAYVPPACATCPTVTQCFPGAPAPATGALPVAFAPGCAQQVGFTPGCAQPAAWVPCPVPGRQPGMGMGLGLGAGAGQNAGALRCPQCNFVFNDANYWNRGYTRCPRCQGMLRVPVQGNTGLQRVAAVQPLSPPPIFRDAQMLHQFRGVCENCHVVNPDIAIPAATAQVPHNFRGVCSNCHTILGLQAAP
ncbi:MAG: hypothetical protein HQL20_03575 [Candidatus Omnitrophica bacterium]|nr:hypothetical protein [Candidatus Omnitrophota bacterium]